MRRIPLLGLFLLGAAAVPSPAQAEQSLHEMLLTAVEASDGPGWRSPEAGVAARIVTHEGPDMPKAYGLAQRNRECLEVTLSAEALARPRSALRLASPIPVTGIAKTLSFWARASPPCPLGLRIILQDAAGIELKIPVADSVSGAWKRYSLAVAPNISKAGGTEPGVAFAGWEILPPKGLSGSLEVRFDLVSTVTDLYAIESADPDVSGDW